jgi:hypothetical protein
MATGGEPNEIMTKACERIDQWFCENKPSLKYYIENGISHFIEDYEYLFESDLYLAFIEVVETGDYVTQLSFYWSDATYALYGKY